MTLIFLTKGKKKRLADFKIKQGGFVLMYVAGTIYVIKKHFKNHEQKLASGTGYPLMLIHCLRQ